MVDAVVEVPYGAHPTSFYPNYGYDNRLHLEWAAAARDDDEVAKLMKHYVLGPENQQQYLEVIGGIETINRIRNWEESR